MVLPVSGDNALRASSRRLPITLIVSPLATSGCCGTSASWAKVKRGTAQAAMTIADRFVRNMECLRVRCRYGTATPGRAGAAASLRESGLQAEAGGARLREWTTVRESAGRNDASAATIAAVSATTAAMKPAAAPENGA